MGAAGQAVALCGQRHAIARHRSQLDLQVRGELREPPGRRRELRPAEVGRPQLPVLHHEPCVGAGERGQRPPRDTRVELERAVHEPFAFHDRGRDFELAPHDSSVRQRTDVVRPGSVEERPIARHQRAKHVEVIHEVAPHDVVCVADAGRTSLVRKQQQPWVLDPARREHAHLRRHRVLPAVQAIDAEALDASAVGSLVQRAGARVHEHGEVGRAPELGERVAGDGRPALNHSTLICTCPLSIGGGCGRSGGSGVRAESGRAMCARVVRVERRPRERPAAVRHPWTGRKVDLVQGEVAHKASDRPPSGAPEVSVSAELPPPLARVGPEIAAVEGEPRQGLRGRVWPRAAGFDDADAEPLPVQFAGDGDPRRPRAHYVHAHIRVDLRLVRE